MIFFYQYFIWYMHPVFDAPLQSINFFKDSINQFFPKWICMYWWFIQQEYISVVSNQSTLFLISNWFWVKPNKTLFLVKSWAHRLNQRLIDSCFGEWREIHESYWPILFSSPSEKSSYFRQLIYFAILSCMKHLIWRLTLAKNPHTMRKSYTSINKCSLIP